MKNIKNSLALSSINLNAYDAESDVAKSYPAEELFDNRHDFSMGLSQSALAVLMVFTNESCLTNNNAHGIRRSVSVSLIDVTNSCVLETSVIRVSISRFAIKATYRVDFPFVYANINPCHTYKVSVRDESSKQIIGDSYFQMFDELKCGKEPDKWYVAERGGITPNNYDELYKALDIRDMDYCKVMFYLVPQFKEEPFIMPEVEIRVFFPDGSVESNFCTPVCCPFESDRYYVEMSFFTHSQNKGVCYAEAICMDYVFAGFAFGTNGPVEYGYCQDDDLKYLDEYSLSAATERFRNSFNRSNSDSAENLSPEEQREYEEFEETLQSLLSYEDDVRKYDDLKDNDDDLSDDDLDINDDDLEDDDDLDDDADLEDNGDEDLGLGDDDDIDLTEDRFDSSDDSLLADFDCLTGLKSVKEKLEMYEKVVRFNKIRRDNGLSVSGMPLHAMFLGSPGTGKTTVAKMLGKMLAKAGVLSKGHVVVKERSTLLGPNYSNEETNTLKAIEEAQGGILLIDEAYQLYQPNDSRDPGRFVIEALMTALADDPNRDWMLILAGYPEEMKRMFEMNPGFKSRIPDTNIYMFEDFTEPELMEIAERYLERHQYSLSAEARDALAARLQEDFAQRDKKFGNARHVVNLIQTEILPAMAVRVMSAAPFLDIEAMSEIQACDIPQPAKPINLSRQRIGFCS